MDGFDVQGMGYVAPALVRDWRIPSSSLGPVFSAALVGVLIGSLSFSMLADKFGRRPVLVLATLYFSICTLLTARTNSVNELLLIRFIGGIGLGGIMPNAMALAGEYSPKRIRVTVMMLISCGFTAGAAFGGFIAAWLIPAFGWRSVFYFGGSVPLLISLAMFVALPESLQFLSVHRKNLAQLDRWLCRIDPNTHASGAVQYAVAEQSGNGVPAVDLFRKGRTKVTLLLWVVNFMNLLNLYFLASWVPTVVGQAGYSTRMAVLVGTAVQVGGTLGALGNARLIEKAGFVRALAPIFAIGSASIAFIGMPFLPLAGLFLVTFVAGWCVTGAQPGLNAMAGVYYPTSLRSTGIGWSLGIGRIGAIIGPVVGGALMALKWTPREVFVVAAVPAGISSVVMLALGGLVHLRAPGEKKADVLAH
jgi:AAHS family 4-hydroxybenzoate transporter-like MFS transporter